MKAGSWLVKDVKYAALALWRPHRTGAADLARRRLKMCGQLHALRFASGKRSGRLAQPQVAESDLFKHAKLLSNLGNLSEELQRFLHREIENLVNILSPVPDIEHLGLVACALAFLANQFDVGEKLHLNGVGAVALTGLAAAAWNVER